MAKSQKITITTDSAGKPTAAIADSDVFDVLTTAISTDTVVSGTHGLIQRASFFVAGMSVNNYLKTKSFNFLGSR